MTGGELCPEEEWDKETDRVSDAAVPAGEETAVEDSDQAVTVYVLSAVQRFLIPEGSSVLK